LTRYCGPGHGDRDGRGSGLARGRVNLIVVRVEEVVEWVWIVAWVGWNCGYG